jgi:ribosomal protein S27AE
MRCPDCGSTLRKRKTPELLRDERTGLLIRVRLIECPKCGPGKDVETHQVSFYGDERANLGPLGDQTL